MPGEYLLILRELTRFSFSAHRQQTRSSICPGVDRSFGHHGHHQAALAAGLRRDDGMRAELGDGARGGFDVAAPKRALAGQQIACRNQRLAAQQAAQAFVSARRSAGDIGDGSFASLLAFAPDTEKAAPGTAILPGGCTAAELYPRLWHETLSEGCCGDRDNPSMPAIIDVRRAICRADLPERIEESRRSSVVQYLARARRMPP